MILVTVVKRLFLKNLIGKIVVAGLKYFLCYLEFTAIENRLDQFHLKNHL